MRRDQHASARGENGSVLRTYGCRQICVSNQKFPGPSTKLSSGKPCSPAKPGTAAVSEVCGQVPGSSPVWTPNQSKGNPAWDSGTIWSIAISRVDGLLDVVLPT